MKRALAFIVLGLLVIVVAIAAAAWLKVAVAKLDVAGAREPQAQLRNSEQNRRRFDGCEIAVVTPPCQVRHPAKDLRFWPEATRGAGNR